jgi:hypothetical protein
MPRTYVPVCPALSGAGHCILVLPFYSSFSESKMKTHVKQIKTTIFSVYFLPTSSQLGGLRMVALEEPSGRHLATLLCVSEPADVINQRNTVQVT